MRVAFAKLCVSVPLAGISRLRKNDRRTYGEAIGVIWLQTSCQPVGILRTRGCYELAGGGFPAVILLNRGPDSSRPLHRRKPEKLAAATPRQRVHRRHHQTNAPRPELDGLKPSRFSSVQ